MKKQFKKNNILIYLEIWKIINIKQFKNQNCYMKKNQILKKKNIFNQNKFLLKKNKNFKEILKNQNKIVQNKLLKLDKNFNKI